MDRLSSADVDLLEAGRAPAHGHVGQLVVLEPGDTPLDLAALRRWYAGRLDHSAAFRRRLVDVPLSVHRPLWVDDPDFDLDRHVRSLTVDPGDRAGLEATAGRLLGLPLDMDRPPWEAWLLEGLEGGRVALLTKQHLAAVSARAGDEMAVAAVDVDPAPDAGGTPDWAPEHQPGDVDRLGSALASRLRRPTALVEAVQNAARRRRATPPRPVPAVFDAPLTTRRAVATTTLALDAVKAVKDHHDVSVTDVVLAVCAGGLRSWLEAEAEVPVEPLLALVPVSVAGDVDGVDSGQHVSAVVSSLATDTRDPSLRIQVIQDATREARRRRAISAQRLRDWESFAAPAVLGKAGRIAARTIRDAPSRPANLIVANIPGPAVPIYTAGAQVSDLFFFGPLAQGVPLAISVVSIGDRMDVALLGCPDVGPPVHDLAGHLERALDELVATVPLAGGPGAEAVAAPAVGAGAGAGGASVIDETRAALERSRQTRDAASRVGDVLDTLAEDPGSQD